MNYKRIAVLGARGQIGSGLVAQLGEKSIALTRANLALDKTENIIATLATFAPDAIINAAAYTNVEQAQDDEMLARIINADAPKILAEYAANNALPFIHISTDYVFDGKKSGTYIESDITAPINVYGKSKAEGEQAVLLANPAAIIVRTSWVNHWQGKNFIHAIAKKARTKKRLSVVDDQWGAPCFANDIAQGIIHILSRMEETKFSGILHLTNQGYTTWHGLACALVEQMRQHETLLVEHIDAISSLEFKTRALRPLNCRLDCSKAKQMFELTLAPWQDALEETVGHWYAHTPT